MTKAEIRTTTFNYDGKYYVDIVSFKINGANAYEAFLYDRSVGFKMHMFGTDGKKQEFIDLVELNVDDYIPLYEKIMEHLESVVV